MTIALDPVLCNVVYTINLVMHLRRPRSSPPWQRPFNDLPKDKFPCVSVLLPLVHEREDSILATVRCLVSQTYPKERLEVLFVLEPDDEETVKNVGEALRLLRERGVEARILFTDGGVRLKPHALNRGLEEAGGEVICVYDADDRFPEDQVEAAVTLMVEKGYDAVQPKIFRKRRSVTGNHLMLDTFTWNRKFLPVFYDMAGVFPLSGEGFFVRKDAMEDVGGWPEVLTEDAYLAILLAEKGKRFGLLDSVVEELAPRGWRSHFRQRLRWFRGYLTCFGRTLKAGMPLKKKLALLIPFLAPITCAFSLVTWIFMVAYWLSWAYLPEPWLTAPWMLHWLYTDVTLLWSAFLAYIGNAIVMFSLMHSIAGTEVERYAPLALTAPLYWMFLGVAAIASFFKSTKYWGKTVR